MTIKKKFNNKENTCIKHEGKEIWLSRSMAVMGIVLVKLPNEPIPYVLISERGTGCPDFNGCYNLVCGYLDRNESIYNAVMREIWEETGLDLTVYKFYKNSCISDGNFNNNAMPVIINDGLDTTRENVTNGFIFKLDLDELPKTTSENSEPNEVGEIVWMQLTEENINKYEFCFNHETRLRQTIENFTLGGKSDKLYFRNTQINSLGGAVRIDI